MPLTATTSARSVAKGIARSRRTGQKAYCTSAPGSPHSIAVWSSLPPKVPTPRCPVRLPKLCPFSTVPRYSPSCSGVVISAVKAGSAAMSERSIRASASPTTRAEELDSPAARGRLEVTSMSAPTSRPGKLVSRRSATVRTYPLQCPSPSSARRAWDWSRSMVTVPSAPWERTCSNRSGREVATTV